MLTAIRKFASSDDANSLGNRMRARRFQLFEKLTAKIPRPIRIIDIGGTNRFWEINGWTNHSDAHITLVNLTPEPQMHDNIDSRQGDATDLHEYADQSFDIAFSNSTIEHLFTLENQNRMAKEIRRVGKAFWVQTPNFWFPMEPHFHVPGWQWMPMFLRVAIIRRFTCGWRGPCPDPNVARRVVGEIRLMTRGELKKSFPGAKLYPEKFSGLVKSWIVLNGFQI